MADKYVLYYWPPLPGRGEFIRLIFEDAGEPYVDVGRLDEGQGGGMREVLKFYSGENDGHSVFAPPVLKVGDLILGQMANICLYLGRSLGLAPEDEGGWHRANQIMMTISDLMDEVHHTHHPLAVSLYYEDQQDEAKKASVLFLESRLPRFLGYLERVLNENGGEVLVGNAVSYVDLALFQLLAGIKYAFPKAFAKESAEIPNLLKLCDRVAERPRLAAYLASPRRLAFNEDGIFRHYPELDLAQ